MSCRDGCPLGAPLAGVDGFWSSGLDSSYELAANDCLTERLKLVPLRYTVATLAGRPRESAVLGEAGWLHDSRDRGDGDDGLVALTVLTYCGL